MKASRTLIDSLEEKVPVYVSSAVETPCLFGMIRPGIYVTKDVAEDKNTLVFCEVKTRKTNVCGSPFEAITKSKYQNIKKGIFLYLQENSTCKKFRVDAISIVLEPKLEIKHLKNI